MNDEQVVKRKPEETLSEYADRCTALAEELAKEKQAHKKTAEVALQLSRVALILLGMLGAKYPT